MMNTKSTRSEADMRMMRKVAAYLTWFDIMTDVIARKLALLESDYEIGTAEDKEVLIETANEIMSACEQIKKDITWQNIAQA